jgi:hypothetical protein
MVVVFSALVLSETSLLDDYLGGYRELFGNVFAENLGVYFLCSLLRFSRRLHRIVREVGKMSQ